MWQSFKNFGSKMSNNLVLEKIKKKHLQNIMAFASAVAGDHNYFNIISEAHCSS